MSTRTITTITGLRDAGLLGENQPARLDDVAAKYAIAITPAMSEAIKQTGPSGPIAKQFVPTIKELAEHPDETPDPISDIPFTPIKGIVHRYPDRALLKAVNVCPVYCRFCFRREMVGPSQGAGLSDKELEAALAYVVANPQIKELIITGGDPLILSPRRIQALTNKIAALPNITKIRWHTRVPIVMPDAITSELIASLTHAGVQTRIAIHANHPDEFGTEARQACEQLSEADIELLSQSVLLKGINDDVETLKQLMHSFIRAGAMPYYIHHGDLARGTAHFRTTIAYGLKLMKELSEKLPSTECPKYILDVPGGTGKIELNDATCIPRGEGRYTLRCRDGSTTTYRDIVEIHPEPPHLNQSPTVQRAAETDSARSLGS